MTRHRRTSDDGFTLVELLVVVVILGILIGIAIPVYLNYRRSANDRSAQSDLRGAISTLELCQNDNGSYPATISAGATAGTSGPACATQTISLSSGTTLVYFPASSTNLTSFIISATNSGGSGKRYCFSNASGGGVTTTGNAVTQYRVAC